MFNEIKAALLKRVSGIGPSRCSTHIRATHFLYLLYYYAYRTTNLSLRFCVYKQLSSV